jgi:hypothetical protein
MTPLGTAALKLAGKGLRVFPCVERGKEPALAGGFKRATTDLNIISGWWRAHNFNIGIAAGPGSGVWVVDIDDDAGEALLRQHEAEHGTLPPTVEVVTGRGRHLYFRWPTDTEIRNRQDNPIMAGIDVRGEGGYVLAPPSLHPSGRCYAWSVDSAGEFADAPEWLIDLVTSKSRTNGSQAEARSPDAWRTFISENVDGSRRSNAIARLSGLLLRRYLDPLVTLDLARMFNTLRCQPPLADEEVVSIVTNITRSEQERRERNAP